MSQEDRENTPRCRTKWVWIVDDALPSYYRTYAGHEYTWKVGINYVANGSTVATGLMSSHKGRR